VKTCFRTPPKVHLKALSEVNVEKVNSLWHHRYEGSDQFISYSIKYHLSIGMFDESNDLLAWCLRYDSGSLAMLQVDKNHLRKGYGSVVTKLMCKKIADEFDSDVVSSIVPGNEKSLNMFLKLGFKKCGPHTWLVVKK
jgi:RimJ/RimL family protein N-acetyltransferase